MTKLCQTAKMPPIVRKMRALRPKLDEVAKICEETCPSLDRIFHVLREHNTSTERDWVTQCLEKNWVRFGAPSDFTPISVGVSADSINVDSLFENCWDANDQLFIPPAERDRRAAIKEEIERKMPKEAQEELRRLEQNSQQDEEYTTKRALADRMLNLQHMLLEKIKEEMQSVAKEIPEYVRDLELGSITWQRLPVQAQELAARYVILRK